MNNKGIINNKIYDILTEDEFAKKEKMFSPQDNVAIHRNGLLYPVRGDKIDRNKAGAYNRGAIIAYVDPSVEERKLYTDEKMIDFSNSKTISEVIEKQNELTSQERTVLTSPDNIYIPVVKDTNSPEMVLFKKAIAAKQIDLDKYEMRFGDNYMNDKRILTRDSITLNKLVSMSNALDIEVTLTFRDANPEVPNPMGIEVSGVLTGKGGVDDESETNNG